MSADTTPQERESKRRKKNRDADEEEAKVDPWAIEKFAPAEGSTAPFAEESSFATLFPKYRERYIQENWKVITATLKSHGIDATLDLLNGSLSVRTTRKTVDPYIILKARDMIKLISRGVAIGQAVKILDDAMTCDIIKIGGMIRNNEKFVKRRQRIVGPDGSTLKAIELLTQCYVFVQGNTVSVMGPYKSLKEVRRIVTDCMRNIHPIYRIKELMIRRELAKDPQLANESWDRFLPKFKKRHLTTSEKTAKKKMAEERAGGKEHVKEKEKKVYTPFPPPQQPRKIDLQLESGEYFLKPREKKNMDAEKKKQKQLEVVSQKNAERSKAYVAPAETASAPVEEKIKKRKRNITS